MMNKNLIKWRFLDTGKGNAFFNMAFDEVLLKSVCEGKSPPVFRLFEWEPRAITFGYAQNPCRVLNLEKCQKDGIDITRRVTGGRAVLHDKEISYSVIGFKEDVLFGNSLMETYGVICRAILGAFKSLGIDADYEWGVKKGKVSFGSSTPCFQSVSKYEVTYHGAKLAGSAQRRFRHVFIQQGSILYGPGQEKIVEYIKDTPSHQERTEIQKPIDLAKEINNFSSGLLRGALFMSFGKIITEHEFSVSEMYEIDETLALVKEKYSSKGWVLGNGK